MNSNDKQKAQEKKEKTSFMWMAFTVLIIIFITVILVVNVFCTLVICCPGILSAVLPSYELTNTMTETEKIEASLLANGLSIIGIAVAVWASLNIANSINKKDFESTKKRMTAAEKGIKEIEATIAPLRNEASGIKNTLIDLFLQELLKIPSIDIPSRYFYQRFSEIVVSDDIISYLTKIEQDFHQVYVLHDSQKETKLLRIKKANEGISLIEEASMVIKEAELDNKEKDLICLYLKQRKAELSFYKGYESDGYINFFTALKDYEGLIQDFGCTPMPEHNTEYIIPSLTDCESVCRDLKIYFANTIGEAYSKIMDNYQQIILNSPSKKEELTLCGEKAIFYCKCATIWESETFEKPEVYLRNLGCAYERWDRTFEFGSHYEEILECYKKAFELTRFDERPARIKSVYHTLLSYYNRYINNKCHFFTEDDNVSLNVNFVCDDEIICKITEFYDYSLFAKNHLVKNNIPYVMNGFALSNVIALKILNEDTFQEFSIDYCMRGIFDNIHTLDLLNVNDTYTKQLVNRYGVLEKHLSHMYENK